MKREDVARPAPVDEAPLGDIEVLIVPGGGGTRRNVDPEIDFIKAMYPKVSNTPRHATHSILTSIHPQHPPFKLTHLPS
jgi:hypothetical protein